MTPSINTMESETVLQIIHGSSLGSFTKDLLKELTIELSLNMDSVNKLISIITENDLNESATIINISKAISKTNEGGLLLKLKLNDVLTYLHTFVSGRKVIDTVRKLRLDAIDSILSKPKQVV